MSNEGIILQVLICTYGEDGIKRVAKRTYPNIKGVEYLISWQTKTDNKIPEKLKREDIVIFKTDSVGLSKNRNHALSKASARYILIGDDDVDYYEEGLKSVIKAFQENPHADIITFRFDCKNSTKLYPAEIINLQHPSKGFYVSSIEIALKRESIHGKIWFNENFGIGALFPSGEEDVFIKDCLNSHLNGIYYPSIIARHDGATTSDRILMLPTRPQTKGAVFLQLHPHSWPLRMIAHALREIPLWRKGLVPNPLSYVYNWIKGVCIAKKSEIFPTPDYSNKYSPNG